MAVKINFYASFYAYKYSTKVKIFSAFFAFFAIFKDIYYFYKKNF